MDIMERMRDPELLKAMGIGDKLLGSLIVMVLGLAVCMIVLYIIQLAVKLLRIAGSRDKDKLPEAPAVVPVSPLPAVNTPAEDEGEVVAAIIAAVTAMQDGKPFMIRNIAIAADRESWSAAGLADAFKNRKMTVSNLE
jgi:sodium pump decarboxylase gamma subunit